MNSVAISKHLKVAVRENVHRAISSFPPLVPMLTAASVLFPTLVNESKMKHR